MPRPGWPGHCPDLGPALPGPHTPDGTPPALWACFNPPYPEFQKSHVETSKEDMSRWRQRQRGPRAWRGLYLRCRRAPRAERRCAGSGVEQSTVQGRPLCRRHPGCWAPSPTLCAQKPRCLALEGGLTRSLVQQSLSPFREEHSCLDEGVLRAWGCSTAPSRCPCRRPAAQNLQLLGLSHLTAPENNSKCQARPQPRAVSADKSPWPVGGGAEGATSPAPHLQGKLLSSEAGCSLSPCLSCFPSQCRN